MTLLAHQLSQCRGEHRLFDGLDFALQPGEALWVRGANGSGKTSLLRLLCGLAWPAAGEVRWRGVPLQRQREVFHAELLFAGHAPGVKDELTALENLHLGAALAGQACAHDEAVQALARLGLPAAMAGLPARVLSQGQRKRVALARLMLPRTPALWVLDEPFASLDTATVLLLQQRLQDHLARGGLLVCTTHQPLSLQGAAVQTLWLPQPPPPRQAQDGASWRLH